LRGGVFIFQSGDKKDRLVSIFYGSLKRAQIRESTCFSGARGGLSRRCGIHAAFINPTLNVAGLINLSQKVHVGSAPGAFAFRHPVVIKRSDNLRPLSSVQLNCVGLSLLSQVFSCGSAFGHAP